MNKENNNTFSLTAMSEQHIFIRPLGIVSINAKPPYMAMPNITDPNAPQGYEDSNKLNIDKNNIHAIILSMNVFNKNFTILTHIFLLGLLKHRWHNTNNCTIISEIVYSGMS